MMILSTEDHAMRSLLTIRRTITPAFPDLYDTLRAIRALADQFDSRESGGEDLALDALQAGRPVFWTSARYHNQRALTLHHRALQLGLAAAIAEDPRRTEEINTLIPLSPAAENALEEARWQIAGMQIAAE
jgi:hypothetical protein